jgi:periplasmic copper chaperone A
MESMAKSLMAGIAVAGAIALTTVAARAQNYHAGPIEVDHPWALATTGFDLTNAAAYMRLSDHGAQPDQLVSAASPVAAKVALHVFDVENGVYGMHPVSAIEIASGAAVTVLEPGGAHVMLEGLKKPLKPGESFPLTLNFKKAGTLQIEVQVESTGQAVAEGNR